MRPRLFPRLLMTGLLLASACVSSGEPEVGFGAAWLTPSGVIPPDVVSLRIVRVLPGDRELEIFERSVGSLEDADMNGRRELPVPSLPTGEVLDLEIQGKSEDGSVRFVGRTGPVFLNPGERRYFNVAMYAVSDTGTNQAVDRDDPPPATFLHTATTLADGRILIAGGFDTVESMATCPAGLPDGEQICFALEATNRAFLFDPSTALFHPTQATMIEARGGHTASRVTDGRVVISGGATHGVLAIVKVGEFADFREFVLLPRNEDGEEEALANAEVFDPELEPELEDLDRDGDPGRGTFVGDPSQTTRVGIPINDGRFMHAAAAVPGANTVLIAGGMGSGSDSYEVFDIAKPGGMGVYDNQDNPRLSAARTMPSALALGSGTTARVWIVGGAAVTSNGQLADAWSPDDTDPNGVLETGPELGFPGGATDRPEHALLRPAVAALEDGDFGLVTGWYGPRCPAGMGRATPVFADATTQICAPGPDRSYTIDNSDGSAAATATPSGTRHAFGDAVVMGDGRVLVVGGTSDATLQATEATLVYTNVTSGTAAGAGGARLDRGRLFPASAALLETGVLVTGGFRILVGDSIGLVPEAEAIMYNPPGRTDGREMEPGE